MQIKLLYPPVDASSTSVVQESLTFLPSLLTNRTKRENCGMRFQATANCAKEVDATKLQGKQMNRFSHYTTCGKVISESELW